SFLFFFSSRRRHTRSKRDWSSDVCSSDLVYRLFTEPKNRPAGVQLLRRVRQAESFAGSARFLGFPGLGRGGAIHIGGGSIGVREPVQLRQGGVGGDPLGMRLGIDGRRFAVTGEKRGPVVAQFVDRLGDIRQRPVPACLLRG